ncbi:MAG: ester cyclase [Hyphomicrobiaceae bacterium]|nr:ester cyclase [Hyphomicrobiaceae bacterium]
MDRRQLLVSALAAGAALAAMPASAASGLEANKALVRRFYDPFVTGNVDLYDEILTEDWVEHPPAAPGQAPGRAGYKPVVQHVRTMMPDITFAIGALVAEGDLVVARSTLSATYSTNAFGFPATGKRFSILTMDMHRIAGGRIAETWHVEDWQDMMRQVRGS